MINLDDVDLSAAESAYLVANTPLYLIRKLRTDSTVLFLARKLATTDLLDALKDRLAVPPLSSRERVLPIVLLVAISLKQNYEALRDGSKLQGGNYRWYTLVAENLLAIARPTSSSTIAVRSAARFETRSTRSTAGSTFSTFNMSN